MVETFKTAVVILGHGRVVIAGWLLLQKFLAKLSEFLEIVIAHAAGIVPDAGEEFPMRFCSRIFLLVQLSIRQYLNLLLNYG